MEEEAHGLVLSCKKTPNLIHVCSYPGCSKTFSRPNRLIIHLRTHTGEKPYVCEVEGCGKQYARSTHLKRHQDTAHIVEESPSEVPSKCCCPEDGCGLVFKNNQHLQRHINRRHKTVLYKCNFEGCEKIFNKHQHLKTHEFEHTKINPYVCPHEGCDVSFRIQSKLKRHLKVHTGYSCEMEGCSETFSTWTLLRKHKAFDHSQEYKCSECGKAFKQKQWLRQHKKIHSSSRELFACQWENCGRSYLDHRNLMAHIRSYHEGRRFACNHEGCDRKFVTEQKLKEHQQIHKGNRPPHKKRTKPKKPKTKSKTKKVAAKLLGIDPSVVCDIQMTSESELEIDSASESKTACETTVRENNSGRTHTQNEENVSCTQSEICRNEIMSHSCKNSIEDNMEHTKIGSAVLTDYQQNPLSDVKSRVCEQPACIKISDCSCPRHVDCTILTVQDLETNKDNLVESKSGKCLKLPCSSKCALETKDHAKVVSLEKTSIPGQSCMENSFVTSSVCVHDDSCLSGNDKKGSIGSEGLILTLNDGKILTGNDGTNYTGVNDGKYFTESNGECLTKNDGDCLTGNDGKCFAGNDGKCLSGNDGKCLSGNDGNKDSVIDIAHCGKRINWNVDLTTSLSEI